MPKTIPQENDKQFETVDLNGVEIFSEGRWNGDDYSGDDLQAMVDAHPHVGFQPVVKAGHADGQEDEKKARQVFDAPALGYVSRIYRSGKKLLADLIQVPKRFADLIKTGAYKRISSEIYWGFNDEANGKKFPRVLKAVAFLGDRIPALTNLKEIEALYEKGDGGRLYAYDEKGNEYRAYNAEIIDSPMRLNRYRPNDAEIHEYTIEKRGDEWCLIAKSTGKTLGCHDTEEGALAQERAVQANKNELQITAKQMAAICPPCAENMRRKNFSTIKLTPMLSAEGALTYAFPGGAPEGLCDKFSPDEGFRTRCMDSSAAAKVDDPGAFCNALKVACKDKGLLSSDQPAKEYAMEIMEKDGQHCVMDGEKTVKCYPTKAEAEDHVKKMSKGGPNMDEKKFEELKAQVKADAEAKEAAIKKDYDDKMAALKAEADSRDKAQGEKIKTLERQRFDDQNKQWIKDQKAAGHLAPVEEPRILAIFSELFEDARIVKFSQDGKEATETLMQSVKSFVENRPTIFAELSKPGDDLPVEADNVGEEVDRLTVKWMNDKNVKEYGQAMKAVLAQKENAELAQKYLRMQKQ